MPSRKPTKRERALEALIKLTTGHGPFRAHLFKSDTEPWQRNGYGRCTCIYVCDHCDRLVILCATHGSETSMANMRVLDETFEERRASNPYSRMRWKRGARWPN